MSVRTTLMPKIDGHPVVLTASSNSIRHRLILSVRTGDVPPILELGRSVANPQLNQGLIDDMIAQMWVNLCEEYIRHFRPALPDGLIDWGQPEDA